MRSRLINDISGGEGSTQIHMRPFDLQSLQSQDPKESFDNQNIDNNTDMVLKSSDNWIGCEIEIPNEFFSKALFNKPETCSEQHVLDTYSNEAKKNEWTLEHHQAAKSTAGNSIRYDKHSMTKIDALFTPCPLKESEEINLFNNDNFIIPHNQTFNINQNMSTANDIVDNAPAKPTRDATLTKEEGQKLQQNLKNMMSKAIPGDMGYCTDRAPAKPNRGDTLTKEECQELRNGLTDTINEICINDKRILSTCVDNAPAQPHRDTTLTKEERQKLQYGLECILSKQHRGQREAVSDCVDNAPAKPFRELTLTKKDRQDLQKGINFFLKKTYGGGSFCRLSSMGNFSTKCEQIKLKTDLEKEANIIGMKSYASYEFETEEKFCVPDLQPKTTSLLDLFR